MKGAHVGYIKDNSHVESDYFVLWSVHDNTIGPFFATLGKTVWDGASVQYFEKNEDFPGAKSPFPAFASLLNLEVLQMEITSLDVTPHSVPSHISQFLIFDFLSCISNRKAGRYSA